MAGAVSIMLAHTHPTGDISPSQEDYGVTLRLIEAGRILGIPLEDHVVVSLYNQSCVSIREANPSLWAKV
jgi:DNA repair protein RadC